jgi:uncharacterized repeat protein (TIGR02543 family)
VAKPADPTRTNYVFTGWFSDVGLTTPFVFTTPITESITIYAGWNALYTVTYNLNSGSGTVPTQTPTVAGATFSVASITGLSAPANTKFKEWNTLPNGFGTGYNTGATVTMLSSNLTLYAIWEYTITSGADGEWSKNSSSGFQISVNTDGVKLKGVYINDALLDSSMYDVGGNTTITLKPVCQTIASENNVITILFTDGVVSTNLTIMPPVASGNSYDLGIDPAIIAIIAVAAIGGIGAAVYLIRKH